MKEIKLSPNISQNDIDYRVKQANKFLEKQIQVRVTLTFKGREKLHEKIGLETLQKFVDQCKGTHTPFSLKRGKFMTVSCTLNPSKQKPKI